MQPIIAAMIRVREVFYAALLRSFRRTKSIIQTILKVWISPSLLKGNGSVNQPIGEVVENECSRKGYLEVDEFLSGVENELRGRVDEESLLRLSDGLKTQMEQSMLDNEHCMLPSYNHQLPTGTEKGTYLALDVGGSTFRVALVRLLGCQDKDSSRIDIIRSFKINQPIKALEGSLFFDWMAQRIGETLYGRKEGRGSEAPLSMGLAWSFPIKYVIFTLLMFYWLTS